jgi:hypothetical protein
VDLPNGLPEDDLLSIRDAFDTVTRAAPPNRARTRGRTHRGPRGRGEPA